MAKKVVLYSTSGCPLCAPYKVLFQEKGQAYEERNTTENPAYLDDLAGKGIYVLPTVLVNDDVVAGFRPNTLTELLAA